MSQGASRRRFLGAVGAAAVTALAGCRAPICTASVLSHTDPEDTYLSSVASSRGGITIYFWEPAGTDANPVSKIRFFDANGREAASLDVPAGARQVKLELETYDVENGRGLIRTIDADGNWIDAHDVEVEC